MKKIFITLSMTTLIASGFISCKKVKDLVPAFEIQIPAQQTPVPTVAAGGTVFFGGSASFNVDSAIKKHASSYGISKVSSVKIKSVELSMFNGDADHRVSNFETVKVNVATVGGGASADLVNTTIANVSTEPHIINGNDVDIKTYLTGATVNYVITGTARKAVTRTDLKMNVKLTLLVKP